jgi:hypothetical protein
MIRLGAFNGPDISDYPRAREARRKLFEYLRRSPEDRAERRLFVSGARAPWFRLDVTSGMPSCN